MRTTEEEGAEPVREEEEMEVDQGVHGGDDQAAGVHQAKMKRMCVTAIWKMRM